MTEQQFRDAVVAEARSWLGTPYHHQADLKGVGVDCAMILIAVYSAVGAIEHFDPRPYPPDWMLHRDSERYLEHILPRAIEVDSPKPGDVVLMKFGRTFSHSAIVIEDTAVIHAFSKDRRVVLGDYTQYPFKERELRFFSVWKE